MRRAALWPRSCIAKTRRSPGPGLAQCGPLEPDRTTMIQKLDGEAPRLADLNYLVTAVLGTGSHSTVLLVTNRKAVGGRYALKVLKREGPADDLAIERARAE